jgi:hypothetical protein
MNTKIKTALLCRSTERGAVLPVILGLGLIMTVAGLTTVISSQNDQVTATAQQSTAKSLSVAETGVANVQDLINNLRVLSTTDLVDWKTTYDGLDFASCATSGVNNKVYPKYVDGSGNGQWINVAEGRFRIANYTYNGADTGTLEIEAEATGSRAASKLEVQLPVDPPGSVPVPALWVSNIKSVDNNQFDGNVMLQGCITSSDGVYINDDGTQTENLSDNISGDTTANAAMALPDVPDLPADGECTPSPTETTNGKNDDDCYYNINALTGGETLPRIGDLPASDDNYHYLIEVDGNGDSIDTSGTVTVNPTATNKVMFYLKGNIKLSGGALIDNSYSGTKPTHLQIFGSDGTADHYCTTAEGLCTTTSIHFGGNPTIEGFILAPEATAGGNGCGSSPSCVLGALWIETWDGSSSTTNLVVSQTADWSDFDFITPWQPINPASSWQRGRS